LKHAKKLGFDFRKRGCRLAVDEDNVFAVPEDECPGRGGNVVCLEDVRAEIGLPSAFGGYHIA